MYPQVRVMNCRKGIGEEGRREEGKGEREERGERGREGREKKERRERSEDNRMGGEREKIKVCMECSDHSTAVCLPIQPLLLGTGQFGETEQWPQQLLSCAFKSTSLIPFQWAESTK